MRHNPGLPRLLLTRPHDAAMALARLYAGRADILISPLIDIVATGETANVAAGEEIIVTSQNTLPHLTGLRPGRAHAVGPRTAQRLAALGWEVTAHRDADALVGDLTASPPNARLVHLRAEHGRGQVADRLNNAGIETETQVLYQQRLCPLSDDAHRWLSGERPVILPLYSPRTARHLAQQGPFAAPVHPVVLSPAVADALGDLGGARPVVANRPDGDAMIDATNGQIDAITLLEGTDPTE